MRNVLYFRTFQRFSIAISFILFFSYCQNEKIEDSSSSQGITVDRKKIALEMRNELTTDLQKWYPLTVDTINGGFLEALDNKWQLEDRQPKFAVMQSRHIYTCSQAALFYEDGESYMKYAKNGFEFLESKMWDSEFGGFYTFVSREGDPIIIEGEHIKRAYSQAFGIYGAVNYFFASNDTAALDIAINAFQWLEEHSYDNVFGGYYQFLSREGEALKDGYDMPPKDQNSSIHLLEAFTDLYKVWKSDLLRTRLEGMLSLIRDKMVTKEGFLRLFFTNDLKPIHYTDEKYKSDNNIYGIDHISFGHDVETAFLMIEASEALGYSHDSLTHYVAKNMTDHSFKYGWDENNGGLYDGGYYLEDKPGVTIVIPFKEWWSQVEGMNTLLIMDELYQDDIMDYYGKFILFWDYCKHYLIDHEDGGWYRGGIDVEPDAAHSVKGNMWTGNYHTTRSLINCIKRLDTR